MQGLLNNTPFMMGMGLLSGNQPSLTPTNPMQNIMQSMMAGQQAKQQMTKDQRDQQAHDLRMLLIQKQLTDQPERKIIDGADGYKYYETGERVLPDVVKTDKTSLPTGMYLDGNGVPQYYETFLKGQERLKTAGKTDVNVNLPQDFPYEIPSGFMPVDVNDPNKGVTPIPGSDKDELSPENAAKTQMLMTARSAYTEVKDLIYDENGDIDRQNLFNAKIGTPFSEGRDLGVRMETGIQAITRAETGAAMAAGELENTKKRFMPSPLDSEKTIKLKLEMYEDFINGSIDLIDPSGRFNEKEFDKVLKERKTARVTPKTWEENGYEYRVDPETGKTQRRKL